MSSFTIPNLKALDFQISRIKEIIKTGLEAGPVVIELRRETRSLQTNAKFHAMIADIVKTVDLGQKYSFDAWKALLVDQFEQEVTLNGQELRHGSKTVISLDGHRAVTIRPSTTKFLKSEASQFIEFLYKFGAENGAKFTDKSLAIYDEAIQK